MFRLHDGNRVIKFSGQILASVSSEDENSLRWSEFTLYKTQANKYILHRIGRSRVYHTLWCHRGLEPTPTTAITEDWVPCSKCKPNLINDSMICPEKTRNKVIITPTAESIITALYMKDENDVFYLTNTAKDLLEEASENDEDIKKAYTEEYLA
jgi:hypothetical protein